MRYFSAFAFWGGIMLQLVQAQLFPQLGGQRAGISALTFLKIEASPRAAALGGAAICLPGDPFAAYVQPALLGELKAPSLGVTHTFWAADIQYTSAAVNFPTKPGVFSINLQGLNSGPMPVRTSFQPQGTGELFYAYYLTGGIAYGKQLTDRFSWGVAAKWVHERLDVFQANTAVVDLGFLYQTDFKNLRFGVMVESFGPNSQLRGSRPTDTTFNPRPQQLDRYPAPTVFQMGLSFTPWQSEDGHHVLNVLAQLNHPSDNAENIRLGAEYAYRQLLFLRAGYKINVNDEVLPTLGLGLRMRMGRFPLVMDYAFDPHRFLGVFHRVGLHITFTKAGRT